MLYFSSRDLDIRESEVNQSAQYGLGLLEENNHLKRKCEELETLYDEAKHELDITKEVSAWLVKSIIWLIFCCFCRRFISSKTPRR